MSLKLHLFFLLLLLPALLLAGNPSFKYVEIKGNKVLKSSYIYESLGLSLPAWYQFWKPKKAKVNPKIINSLQEQLENLYRSEGFYHARIGKKEDNTTVTFLVREGTWVKVRHIDIESLYPIRKLITFSVGERFRAGKFVKIKQAIKEKMLNDGYCNYALDAKAYVDIKKNIADLKYRLKPGGKCFFGLINVHPPKGISKRVVLSRLLFRSNDPYSLEKINKSYSTLSGLEAFDGIELNTRKKDSRVDTDITLFPKQKPTRREIGLGYETNYGAKAFFHWNRKNFTGDAKKLSFDLKYSQREQLIQNGFFWPAVIKVPGYNYYLDFKNSFSYSKLIYDNFEEKKLADKVHLMIDYDWFSVDFGTGLEYIQIKKFKDICNISAGDFFMFYPYGELIFDLRDSKINPQKGFYLSQYYEGGIRYLLSDITYTKMLWEARAIYTLDRLTIAGKSKLGLLKEYDNRLPESKLFYAGGAFSNRAYSYNALGAFDAACGDVGGRTMIDNTLEISHPVYKQISMALFWDSTMISKDTLNFNLDFKHSVGTGIRYNTPIGPVKFDVGFSLEDKKQYAIHFQIGQSY